eukprot:UN31369
MCIERPLVSLIMEYFVDGSVLSVMGKKEFTTPQKYNILLQASAGVWSLHTVNCVHRDLALRNLLIDLKKFRVSVTDFGLSRFLDIHKTADKTSCRTLPIAWSAPESLKDGKYSLRSDVWSFGVLAWELLSEDVPYSGINLLQILHGIRDNKISLPIDPKWPYAIRN